MPEITDSFHDSPARWDAPLDRFAGKTLHRHRCLHRTDLVLTDGGGPTLPVCCVWTNRRKRGFEGASCYLGLYCAENDEKVLSKDSASLVKI